MKFLQLEVNIPACLFFNLIAEQHVLQSIYSSYLLTITGIIEGILCTGI